MRGRLNPAFVGAVRPGPKTNRYGDGNGLYLVVTPTGGAGGKSWAQRIAFGGVKRELGLGSVRDVSLGEARRLALENRRIARSGGDPSGRRESRAPTFARAFDEVIALRRDSWKDSAAMEARWRTSMERHALDRIGNRRVDAVTTADLLAVLQPIWASMDEARRVRQRIDLVMRWTVARGFRSDNPAGEILDAALPKVDRRATPRLALRHGEVASALAKVRASSAGPGIRLAFEAMVLCAVRSGEARNATWDEVNLDSAIWTIPASRMKAGRPHRVPLSDPALAVFREAEAIRVDELVFSSRKPGAAIDKRTFARLMPRLGIAAHPRGFRSSFRDWAAENTDAPPAVMEAALAHKVGDRTEAAYARSDLFERRGTLMRQWADYLFPGGHELESTRQEARR